MQEEGGSRGPVQMLINSLGAVSVIRSVLSGAMGLMLLLWVLGGGGGRAVLHCFGLGWTAGPTADESHACLTAGGGGGRGAHRPGLAIPLGDTDATAPSSRPGHRGGGGEHHDSTWPALGVGREEILTALPVSDCEPALM